MHKQAKIGNKRYCFKSLLEYDYALSLEANPCIASWEYESDLFLFFPKYNSFKLDRFKFPNVKRLYFSTSNSVPKNNKAKHYLIDFRITIKGGYSLNNNIHYHETKGIYKPLCQAKVSGMFKYHGINVKIIKRSDLNRVKI